jgi:hypothetical protein
MPDLLKRLDAWKPNYKRLLWLLTKGAQLNELIEMINFWINIQLENFAFLKST